MTAPKKPTHIYIAGFSDGLVKVGRTSNPRRRMITLRSAASRRAATLDFAWTDTNPDCRRAEWHLILIGGSRFEKVDGSTEYFRADYDTFLRTVLAVMDTWGEHPMPEGMVGLPDPLFAEEAVSA